MTLKIDQFYLDAHFGVMKFLGYSENGMALFNQFERAFGAKWPGWFPKGQRVNIAPDFFQKRAAAGRTKLIPPPQ